ncbi:MAG: hypothetical protein ACKVE4_02980 [Dissulfuribacterales bacterium]
MSFTVGNSVVVKPGVIDPDFKNDIDGWQGRIEELYNKEMVSVRWDSKTLKQMPLDSIIRCENENLDWELMTLDIKELQITTERDSTSDTEKMAAYLKLKIEDDPRLDIDYYDDDDDDD